MRLTGELPKETLLGDPAFVGIYKFGVCLSEKKEKSSYLRSLLSLDCGFRLVFHLVSFFPFEFSAGSWEIQLGVEQIKWDQEA